MKFIPVMLDKSHVSEKAGIRLRSSGNLIFISKITENGLFDRCSDYAAREGMRVLRIGNFPVDGMNETDLIEIIRKASGKLKFLLAHGPERELKSVEAKDIIEVTVKRPRDGKFKLSISGNPGSVHVTKIEEDSPFEDTALRIGDVLLGADTIDFSKMKASQIREFLKETTGPVTFIARSNPSYSSATYSSTMARFKVGGRIFEIDPAIIDGFSDRALSARSRLKRYSTSSAIRLDGNSKRFSYVIDWMRKGRVQIPPNILKREFLDDLVMYGFTRVDPATVQIESAENRKTFNVKNVKDTMTRQQEHTKELEEVEKEMSDEINFGKFASTLASAAFAETITGDDDYINLSAIGKSAWKYNLKPGEAMGLDEGKLGKMFETYMAAYDMRIQHVKGWIISVKERGHYSITEIKKNRQRQDARLRGLETRVYELREEIRFRKFAAAVAREAFSRMITADRNQYIDLTDVALTAKANFLEPGDSSGDSEEKLGEMFESYLVSYGLYVDDLNQWKVRLDFLKDEG